jgi:hypothetical protein
VREGVTMALYVCVVLAAEFVAVSDHAEDEGLVIGVIWGTTMGLAVAHVFAFVLTARLFAEGRLDPAGRSATWMQLVAAGAVALAATIPFLLFALERALNVAAFVVAGLIGAAAYLAPRRAGARRGKSIGYGLAVLAVAVLVVWLKVALSGH